MFVVDTNILIYAADRHCQEHDHCRHLVESWRHQPTPWYLTWNIVYEFLRVSTHPRVFRNPWKLAEAWAFVESILSVDSVGVLTATPKHIEFVTRTVGEVGGLFGNVLHDTHTAVLMREHGIRRIYTRDTDFHRFPFLEVIDPLTSSGDS